MSEGELKHPECRFCRDPSYATTPKPSHIVYDSDGNTYGAYRDTKSAQKHRDWMAADGDKFFVRPGSTLLYADDEDEYEHHAHLVNKREPSDPRGPLFKSLHSATPEWAGWGKVRPWPLSPRLRGLGPHVAPEPLPTPTVQEHAEGDRPKALIGTTASFGLGTKIWFDPDWPEQRLANAHLSITGESGSGKTQSMKSIMADLQARGIPALVLDFKDDYAEAGYAAKQNFSVHDPTKSALPLNPLFPGADPQSGMVNVVFHAYQISEILERIYGLGDIQGFRLREAIKEVYAEAGLPTTPFVPTPGQQFPSFQSVKDKLKSNKDNVELLGHMSPIFDFGFFSATEAGNFASIANSNTVIRLGQLPGNEIKNAVAEFFLMALYNHLIRQSQTHTLTRLLILDEAWRLVQSPFLEPLMREGRAFGLGIFVATQFPTDLPLAVSGSTATQLFFSQTSPGQIAEIERIVAGHSSGAEAEVIGDAVRRMPPLACIVHNKQYEPYVETHAAAFFQRTAKRLPGGDPRHDKFDYEGVPDPEDFSHGKTIGVECCDKAFGTADDAREHTMGHTGQPPCKDCGHKPNWGCNYCNYTGVEPREGKDRAPGDPRGPRGMFEAVFKAARSLDWEREVDDPRGQTCHNCGNEIEFVPHGVRAAGPVAGKWIHSDRPKEHRTIYSMYCMNPELTEVQHTLSLPSRTRQWLIAEPKLRTAQIHPASCDLCGGGGKCVPCGGWGTEPSLWRLIEVKPDNPFDPRADKCRGCGGDGRCSECKGDGTVWYDEGGVQVQKPKEAAYEPKNLKPEQCLECEGDGKCLPCLGDGWIYPPRDEYDPRGPGVKNEDHVECDMCGGSGKCDFCAGKGHIWIDSTTDLAGHNTRSPNDPRGPNIELFHEMPELKTAQGPQDSYVCVRCQGTTSNADHVCDNCMGTVKQFDDTDSDTDTHGDHGTERVVGDPHHEWQKQSDFDPSDYMDPRKSPIEQPPICDCGDAYGNHYTDGTCSQCSCQGFSKIAEIQPFPPGEEVEGENPFEAIQSQEQFFQSPRNRRRQSTDETTGFKNSRVAQKAPFPQR